MNGELAFSAVAESGSALLNKCTEQQYSTKIGGLGEALALKYATRAELLVGGLLRGGA